MTFTPLSSLALLSLTAGSAASEPAATVDELTGDIEAAAHGDPVPLVFCRRRDGIGGVLVSPPATEAAFSNDQGNNVYSAYHLALSEGQISPIEVRDVFRGGSRVGIATQNYNQRAGTWQPGNAIWNPNTGQRFFYQLNDGILWAVGANGVRYDGGRRDPFVAAAYARLGLGYVPGEREAVYNGGPPGELSSYNAVVNGVFTGTLANNRLVVAVRSQGATDFKVPDCPTRCGSIGAYPGISTFSHELLSPDGDDSWRQRVAVFIRGGCHVTRLVDSTYGPSDNPADLYLWFLRNCSLVPEGQIHQASLLTAARFCEANGFRVNLNLRDATTLPELAARILPWCLLEPANYRGQRGLATLLPCDPATGAIIVDPILPAWIFDETEILTGSWQVNRIDAGTRRPYCQQVTWRQQFDADVGLPRTLPMRLEGTAETGPYETQDCSSWLAGEDHAAKAGAYHLLRRVNLSHTAAFQTRPGNHLRTLEQGQVVRVILRRETSHDAPGEWDRLYRIERLQISADGIGSYQVSEIPLTASGVSLIAQQVAAARGTGTLFPNPRTGATGDVNSPTDATPAPTAGLPPDLTGGRPGGNSTTYEAVIYPEAEKDPDAAGADDVPVEQKTDGPIGNRLETPAAGNPGFPSEICSDGSAAIYRWDWYRKDGPDELIVNPINTGVLYGATLVQSGNSNALPAFVGSGTFISVRKTICPTKTTAKMSKPKRLTAGEPDENWLYFTVVDFGTFSPSPGGEGAPWPPYNSYSPQNPPKSVLDYSITPLFDVPPGGAFNNPDGPDHYQFKWTNLNGTTEEFTSSWISCLGGKIGDVGRLLAYKRKHKTTNVVETLAEFTW